jgi:ergothioneine biosynthesis protein EgtB
MTTTTSRTSATAAVDTGAYLRVRAVTEELAARLSAEDQAIQSMPDVSPTKWHRAHTTWFFETFVLAPNVERYEVFHPQFCYLFNSYYEAVGSRHPRDRRGLLSRPGVAEIAAYREHVDRAMTDFLRNPVAPDVLDLIELGLHHEQQHQELLLMDIKHVLAANPLEPAYAPASTAIAGTRALGWIEHEGGIAEMGHHGSGFAFDNEGPRHRVFLEPFALADRPVSCGEWLSFIDDGGYQRPELWLSDGWALAGSERWNGPLYWRRDGRTWHEFTLAGPRALDPAQPVCHVSYYEADAYARWSGARLPTEAEWEAVASGFPPSGRFLDVEVLQPSSSADRDPAFFGDMWEWTGSAYLPYPGFRTAPGAVGEYNGKFMVNQHVLRGGSCATPSGHVRATYRNFFPPSARWAFSGVRLACDLDRVTTP